MTSYALVLAVKYTNEYWVSRSDTQKITNNFNMSDGMKSISSHSD